MDVFSAFQDDSMEPASAPYLILRELLQWTCIFFILDYDLDKTLSLSNHVSSSEKQTRVRNMTWNYEVVDGYTGFFSLFFHTFDKTSSWGEYISPSLDSGFGHNIIPCWPLLLCSSNVVVCSSNTTIKHYPYSMIYSPHLCTIPVSQ